MAGCPGAFISITKAELSLLSIECYPWRGGFFKLPFDAYDSKSNLVQAILTLYLVVLIYCGAVNDRKCHYLLRSYAPPLNMQQSVTRKYLH